MFGECLPLPISLPVYTRRCGLSLLLSYPWRSPPSPGRHQLVVGRLAGLLAVPLLYHARGGERHLDGGSLRL